MGETLGITAGLTILGLLAIPVGATMNGKSVNDLRTAKLFFWGWSVLATGVTFMFLANQSGGFNATKIVGVGFLGFVIFSIAAIGLDWTGRKATELETSKPRVDFHFQKEPPWFDLVTGHNAYRIAIGITPNIRLVNATGYVVSIRRKQNETWSDDIIHNTRVRLGWPDGEASYQLRNIPISGDLLILFLGELDGHRLHLFTNATYAYVLPLFDNFPPGEYKLRIGIDADNIPGFTQDILLNWPGNIEGFTLALVSN